MKRFLGVLCAALLAPAVVSAYDNTGEYGCENVNFGEEALKIFPAAPRACHGVTMRDDKSYAHFLAEVVSHKGDTVTADFIDKKGNHVSKLTFIPPAGQKLTIDGKPTDFKRLERGTKLNLYLEHGKAWGLYGQPGGGKFEIVSLEELK